MDLMTGLVLCVALCVALWVPYFYYNRRGKSRGHTWFTWSKPRGHSDIGPDIGGIPQTKPGKDEARGAHY